MIIVESEEKEIIKVVSRKRKEWKKKRERQACATTFIAYQFVIAAKATLTKLVFGWSHRLLLEDGCK